LQLCRKEQGCIIEHIRWQEGGVLALDARSIHESLGSNQTNLHPLFCPFRFQFLLAAYDIDITALILGVAP
jgi:hypothetical protein